MHPQTCVVPRRQARRPDAASEGEQRREAEATIAANTGVGRLTHRIPGDERRHDRLAKRLPEVESDVRDPERVAGLARGDDRRGRTARPLAVGTRGVGPEAQRYPDRLEPCRARLEERDRAVHPAAHGDGDPTGIERCADGGPEPIMQGVECQRPARNRSGLEQGHAADGTAELGRALALTLGGGDPAALDPDGDPGEVAVSGGVPDQLRSGHWK